MNSDDEASGVEEPSREAESKREARREQEELLKELDSLRGLLSEEQNRSESYLNRLKYLQADFDNYQKKAKKQVEEAAREGVARFIVKLLPLLDDLERAVEVGGRSGNDSTLKTGFEMVLKEFKEVLTREGVRPIEAVGKKFDPFLHEAVQSVEGRDYADNMVVEEMRKGYLLEGTILRPSMVKVAKNTTEKIDKDQQVEKLEEE